MREEANADRLIEIAGSLPIRSLFGHGHRHTSALACW
jgi:hypothetical protein